jgi:hypothetical protein
MNLAQRIVAVVAVGVLAAIAAAHGTEYLLYHVDSHLSLARHGVQALLTVVWAAVGYVLMREAA